MASEHLVTYLNDHLAGSVAAIELLESLEEDHKGAPLETFFAELRADVLADREELKAIMAKLQIEESIARKASAWITEKVSKLKLRVDDPPKGSLRLLQSVEILALGIEGKRLLWRALAAAAEQSSSLEVVDYARLTQRAEEQGRKIEAVRLEAAKKALIAERSRSA
jgi:hypothetical protein